MPILVAINGSSHTEAALRLGAQIARRGREPLTILTVIKHEADRSPAPVDAILARACEIVRPQARGCADQGADWPSGNGDRPRG